MEEIAENQRKLNYHLRLRVFYEERNFGPGVAELMVRVRELGSLAGACQEMEMAYSKAWKIIKKAESDLGFCLMEGKRGGENGGNTVLTELGEDFMERYLGFEKELKRISEELFYKYFQV